MRKKKDTGQNDVLRRQIASIKSGVCKNCGINLYGKGKERAPAAFALPCQVKDCPY